MANETVSVAHVMLTDGAANAWELKSSATAANAILFIA